MLQLHVGTLTVLTCMCDTCTKSWYNCVYMWFCSAYLTKWYFFRTVRRKPQVDAESLLQSVALRPASEETAADDTGDVTRPTTTTTTVTEGQHAQFAATVRAQHRRQRERNPLQPRHAVQVRAMMLRCNMKSLCTPKCT